MFNPYRRSIDLAWSVFPEAPRPNRRLEIAAAVQACAQSGWADRGCLVRLAAAHAAVGEFDEAIFCAAQAHLDE
jgi:hypothetical protein